MSSRDRSRYVRLPRDEHARIRLFCLPSAGLGASLFARWQTLVREGIQLCPIHLPGREARLNETPHRRMATLIAEMAEDLLPWLDRPWALFGHSMGALVAFELARHFESGAKGRQASYLFASACKSPVRFDGSRPEIHDLPDEEFLVELQLRYRALPDAIVANSELRALFLPTLRADFELLEQYRYQPTAALSCALRLFGGTEDHAIATADLGEWREVAGSTFSMRLLPGDHFYFKSSPTQLLDLICAELEAPST
jgi:medium-chain acyl-[acyl-carrier-protein] hydrolase